MGAAPEEATGRASFSRAATAVAAGALAMTPGAALAGNRTTAPPAPTTPSTQAGSPAPTDDGAEAPAPPATDWQQLTGSPADAAPTPVASGLRPITSTGDKTPIITSPAVGATYVEGDDVLADYSCPGIESFPPGTAQCVGTVAVGTPIDTASLGLHDFTVTLESVIGDQGTTTNSYNVIAPPSIAGTVTDAASGDPLPGVFVAVLSTSDFSVAAGSVADGAGGFAVDVPAGDYFLYLIDPAGDHAFGFFGGPTTVTVVEGVTTDADPAMASTRGSIEGTVSEQGTGTPIPGAWAIALSTATNAPETAVVADGAGQFSLPGLAATTHWFATIDPTGAHAPRFNGGASAVPSSTPVVVSPGAATVANGALPVQPSGVDDATLTGTVTEAGSGAPLEGVFVVAMRAADFRWEGGTVTDASGDYSVDVPAGDYVIVYLDSTGTHAMEWYDDLPFYEIESAVPVSAPGVVDADLDVNTGSMGGTITDDPSGTPIEGAWVVAISPFGGIVGGAVTDVAGHYTIAGLPPGSYRATIVDPNGGRVQEYYDDSPDYDGSIPIAITAASATTVDAALAAPLGG